MIGVEVKDSGGAVVESVEYVYDAFDRRLGKVVDGDGVAVVERFVYDGSHIALAFDGEGNLVNRYLHEPGVDRVLASEDASGEVLWGLTDNRGSVRDVVDDSGGVVNHIVYDGFGGVVSETDSTVEFRFGYTGREFDEETGLYFYRARYYDPQVGRFVSEDPIGFAGGDVNLYGYVGNNPINFTDPSGLQVAPAAGAGVAAGAGGAALGAAGAAALVDGPFPVGDIIGVGILGVAGIGYLIDRSRRNSVEAPPRPRPVGGPPLPEEGKSPERTVPELRRPPARPSTSPSPSPQQEGESQAPDPSDCNTCDTDPELSKYVKCDEIKRGNENILIGFIFPDRDEAKAELDKLRREQGGDEWWQQNVRAEPPAIPYRQVSCDYPPSITSPEQGALHYNVTGNIFNDDSSTSVGSLGKCECCEDTPSGPESRVRFAILNMKDFLGRKVKKHQLRQDF